MSTLILDIVCQGIDAVSKYDKVVQHELSGFPENTIMGFSAVMDGKPSCVIKKNGVFHRVKDHTIQPDILISFKSLKAAYAVLLGIDSVKTAYLNYRLYYKGDLMLSAAILRIMDRVESYLFPDFIMKRLLSMKPVREVSKFLIYGTVISSLLGFNKGVNYENT